MVSADVPDADVVAHDDNDVRLFAPSRRLLLSVRFLGLRKLCVGLSQEKSLLAIFRTAYGRVFRRRGEQLGQLCNRGLLCRGRGPGLSVQRVASGRNPIPDKGADYYYNPCDNETLCSHDLLLHRCEKPSNGESTLPRQKRRVTRHSELAAQIKTLAALRRRPNSYHFPVRTATVKNNQHVLH